MTSEKEEKMDTGEEVAATTSDSSKHLSESPWYGSGILYLVKKMLFFPFILQNSLKR